MGNGQSFTMVVNDCETAKKIDTKYGLTTYAPSDSECVPLSDDITNDISFRSKKFTQDAGDQHYYSEYGTT